MEAIDVIFNMNVSSIDTSLKDDVIGYLVNAPCSDKLVEQINVIQTHITSAVGKNNLFLPNTTQLHITLLDLLAPLVTYQKDKDELYREYRETYVEALSDIFHTMRPFTVVFNSIKICDSVVILQGTDQGEFAAMRSNFLKKVELLSGTKPPPKIIHSTIASYVQPVDLDKVRKSIQHVPIKLEIQVDTFRLIRETKTRLRKYAILQTFHLEE